MVTITSRSDTRRSSQHIFLTDAPRRAVATGSEILVADDDESTRRSLTRLLTCHGYATITAASGTEALYLAIQRQPPIIVMDTQMPLMNGFDAARAIKAHIMLAEVQIIALSASLIPRHQYASLFSRILQKPCPCADIIAAIETAAFQHCFNQIAT